MAVAESRSGAGTGTGVGLPEPDRIAMHPNRRAGGQVVAGDDLVVAPLLLGIDQIAADRER